MAFACNGTSHVNYTHIVALQGIANRSFAVWKNGKSTHIRAAIFRILYICVYTFIRFCYHIEIIGGMEKCWMNMIFLGKPQQEII